MHPYTMAARCVPTGGENRILFLTLSYHPNALWNMKRFMKKAQIPFTASGKVRIF